jgi:chemotaxis signal transduction protein
VTGPTSELVLFQVGTRTYAAVVHDAVRIGSVRDVAPETLVLETALGVPCAHARGIVVMSHDDAVERTLVVDQVIGTRSVPEELVHPLPAFAAVCLVSGAVTGFVLLEGDPLLLVDLPTLVRERATVATA